MSRSRRIPFNISRKSRRLAIRLRRKLGLEGMIDRLGQTRDAFESTLRNLSEQALAQKTTSEHDESSQAEVSREQASEGLDSRIVLQELQKNSRHLGPLVKRRIFKDFPGVPSELSIGWVQFPEFKGTGFALGVFPDKDHFAQVAVADDRGRVFVGTEIAMDTHDLQPRFMLSKEGTVSIPYGRRFGVDVDPSDGNPPETVEAIQGGVVGRDSSGRLTWLASWLKYDNVYALEQMRTPLPTDMRTDLEYRDAMAIAFFASYMLPQIRGFLVGFGSGNIFRRLNREAPMGAIRRSVEDAVQARAQGLRASGLEDHFADIMREAGALDPAPGLEAVHGAEPLHLYTSSFSGSYFFSWESGLEFSAALRSLKIEGNLNRFASTGAWLERNARLGVFPTEDTVTRAEASQIDFALLNNPALAAMPLDDQLPKDFDPVHDDGKYAAFMLVELAQELAAHTYEHFPDPTAHAGPLEDASDMKDASGSEWVYRQTMSLLLRRLRLPYRFDVEMRSNLEGGDVALAFTTAGVTMMPNSRFDEERHAWVELNSEEQANMSTDYNLRVGLMMAALAFGADDHVQRVSLHIDSIGLEEAVAEQDSAITQLMSQALAAFERIRNGHVSSAGSKADPKDGDVHGDPAHSNSPASDNHDHDDSVNSTFQSLMRDVDFDEMTFMAPDVDTGIGDGDSADNAAKDDGGLDEGAESIEDDDLSDTEATSDDMSSRASDADAMSGTQEDPLSALQRNPTVRNMATVTFERANFLKQLGEDGLNHPKAFFRRFGAVMDVDGKGGLKPVNADFDLRDDVFAPHASQEEPEMTDQELSGAVSAVLGAKNTNDLSIQRVDVLQRTVNDFHQLANNTEIPSVQKAQQAMNIITDVNDPELSALSSQVTSALIDGTDTPDIDFALAQDLDKERVKARDLLFSGQTEQALQTAQSAVEQMDARFAMGGGIPRYFNSYAERVVYNRLFATPGESTVLIPDNLFYAHMELADVLAQLSGAEESLPHLNAMVSYAPAYPLSHLKLAVQLARNEDWDSARAATLNALRVALDRDDASFAYYRLAYAAWMRDEFDIASAAYLMSEHISPGQIPALQAELQELNARAQSQCVPIPQNVEEAQQVLQHYGLPVWPHTEVASIVRTAARVCVDHGMFVPARTLSVAAARMNDDENGGIDVVQAQFLRTLNA
ncbi:MAG: tetratricopeptide repeat protein [Bifidobacterium crudilactis]|jgi:tetratricopeptide (TPR) repeat protein